MSKKRILIVAVVIVIIGGFFGYNYVMAAPKNIKKAKADFITTATPFTKEFTTNSKMASEKYKDKVITITGKVTQLEGNKTGITINETVFCKFKESQNLKKGDTITVKGLFIGYENDLFEVIKLDKCSLVNPPQK